MALCAAMAGVPALALMHASAPPASMPPHVLAGNAVAVSASAPEPPSEATGDLVTTTSTTPTTTAATTATTVVRAQAVRAAPSTTLPRRTTTTLKAAAKAATPTTRPAPKPASGSGSGSSAGSAAPAGRSQSGGATWYDAAPPGTCAHKTLPMGTIVTIHASNGKTATCKVSDRGPYADGMIIDLAKDVFQQLAPLSQGVVQVTITW